MKVIRTIQGRKVTFNDINTIQSIITTHPNWHRTRISKEICKLWNWRNDIGRLKDIAARSLLRRLDNEGIIKLPPPQTSANNHYRYQVNYAKPEYESIQEKLSSLQPIQIVPVKTSKQANFFRALLTHFHYLGYNGPVGENFQYLIYDCKDRVLGCLLFGAASWRVACRDHFIGWNDEERKEGLFRIANNMRFLLLPEVRVPHLASHVLALINRRISSDWQNKYGHPIALLETYVENNRFQGTCYKAANWIKVGNTTGLTRNYRTGARKVPIKSVWLYPLKTTYCLLTSKAVQL